MPIFRRKNRGSPFQNEWDLKGICMQEWFEKYNSVPRQKTNASIDKPMIIFLGLTLPDFIVGVVAFLSIVMFWDSAWSALVGIVCAVVFCSLSKAYRRHFPPCFLVHFNWSLGFHSLPGIPKLFKKRRFKFYC